MTTIDLILLGMIKRRPMSAYDIQKQVEYQSLAKWVKISTPSIYKKTIQLEEQGFIRRKVTKKGKMPEKAVYSLTKAGQAEFQRLMKEVSAKPVRILLEFNAVIVNLDSLPPEDQRICLADIAEGVQSLKAYLETNLQEKEDASGISETGKAVLRQQYILVQAIESWLAALTEHLEAFM